MRRAAKTDGAAGEGMENQAEERFVSEYEARGPVRMIARRLYRELHPKGMRTNGPCRFEIDATTLQWLLQRWKVESAPTEGGE